MPAETQNTKDVSRKRHTSFYIPDSLAREIDAYRRVAEGDSIPSRTDVICNAVRRFLRQKREAA